MQKLCEICGSDAVYRLSPDLDIQGFDVCDLHKEILREAYLVLMLLGEEEYLVYLEKFKPHCLAIEKVEEPNAGEIMHQGNSDPVPYFLILKLIKAENK